MSEPWRESRLCCRPDVADAQQVEAAGDAVERECGPIDVWVNCAMTTVLAEVADTIAEDFRRTTDVTYLRSGHGTLAALKRMLPCDCGTIVPVGSARCQPRDPLQATYCGANTQSAASSSRSHRVAGRNATYG